MPEYTKEFKIKLVPECLSGKSGSYRIVAKKHDTPWTILGVWIDQYKFGSLDKLSKKLKNNRYTSEFKLSVVQYKQTNQTSLRETAEYFDITNGAIICNWEKKCRESGLSGLEDNKGESGEDMTKSNKRSRLNAPISKSEREELIRLREENRLLRMRIIYKKKPQTLLLGKEAEARKRQR